MKKASSLAIGDLRGMPQSQAIELLDGQERHAHEQVRTGSRGTRHSARLRIKQIASLRDELQKATPGQPEDGSAETNKAFQTDCFKWAKATIEDFREVAIQICDYADELIAECRKPEGAERELPAHLDSSTIAQLALIPPTWKKNQKLIERVLSLSMPPNRPPHVLSEREMAENIAAVI